MNEEIPMNKCISCKTYPDECKFRICTTCKRNTRYILDLHEKISYLENQYKNATLLLEAVTTICESDMIKKIIDKHFELMDATTSTTRQ